MRSKSYHPYWNVWLSARTLEVAACGALLMSSGQLIGEHVYDQPHSHVDSGPPVTTTTVTMFVSGTSTAGVVTFDSTSGTMTFSSHTGRLSDDRKG